MNTTHNTILIALVGLSSGAANAQFCNFDTEMMYSLGEDPNYIASGDIDNDGDIDLIVDSNGPGGDPTTILWNDGTGAFSIGPSLTSGWGFGEVALGDMDGDGDLDVLRCNYFSNGVYFFRNTGEGTFDPGIFYAGGGGCVSVMFTDIDGDKDLDFVTVNNFGSQIRPYRNINGLGFTSVGLFPANVSPYCMDAGDVDNDGDMDIIVGNEDSNTVTVLYNAGDGTFPSNQAFTVGQRPVGVILEDLDGDGNLDAIATNWDGLTQLGNTVSVLMGNGAGSFAPEQRFTTGVAPKSVEAADLNDDGFLDLVVACQVGDVITLLPGNGDGTFGTTQTLDNGTNPIGVTLNDFDGDGAIDIAYVDNTLSRVYTMLNNCDTPVDPPSLVVNWQEGYDNFFNVDRGEFVRVNDQGEIFVGGTTTFNANEEDFLITKFDADGNLLWDRSFNGAGDHYDQPGFMGLDHEGNVYIAGQSWGPSFGVQWLVVKYDTDGNLLWSRRFDGGNPSAQQYPRGYAIGPNGEFAMTGWARDASFQNVYFAVVCYDAMGNEMFDAFFPSTHTGNASAQGEAITFDAMGNIIATGHGRDDDEFGSEMITTKIDPGGTVLWEERLDLTDDTSVNETLGSAITTDNAGNVFVGAGVSINGFSDRDAAIVMYDDDGTMIDAVFDTRSGNAYPYDFTWIAPDQVILSGSGPMGLFAASFDPMGVFEWTIDANATVSTTNKDQHLASSGDGFMYFIDSDGGDVAVEQWSTDGVFQDRSRFDTGVSLEFPTAITSGSGGHVYVVGSFEPEIVNRYDVLLYDFIADTGNTCVADFTGDGVLDFFDVSAFLNAFNADDPIADLTGDGNFDFFDVSAFLNAFTAGCP